MPLKTGQGNIRENVTELMSAVKSPARKKAIATIAQKHNITRKEAQFRQAIKIAQTLSKK